MSLRTDLVLAPPVVKVSVAVEPAYAVLMSMMITNNVEMRSGFAPFIYQVAGEMAPAEQWLNRIIFWAMGADALFRALEGYHWDSFDAFLDALRGLGPEGLRDRLAQVVLSDAPAKLKTKLKDRVPIPDPDALLADVEVFISYLKLAYDQWAEEGDEDVLPFEPVERLNRELHRLFQNPGTLHETIIGHLESMWERWFRAEWARVLPDLQATVEAFQRLDYTNLTAYEAMRAVTGRDLTGIIEAEEIATATHIHFIPSPHAGPYVGWAQFGETLLLDFGARLPAGQARGPALSEAELLMVINALDDEVRLDILRLLAKHETLCSQDIIDHFGLSQSTASRHLRQLSATKLVEEWREEGAKKCYRLNRGRIGELRAALGEMFVAEGER